MSLVNSGHDILRDIYILEYNQKGVKAGIRGPETMPCNSL